MIPEVEKYTRNAIREAEILKAPKKGIRVEFAGCGEFG